MGTSRSYPGPMDRNPLLPPDAPSPPANGEEGQDGAPDTEGDQPPQPDVPSWASVKAAMTRLSGSTHRGAEARGAVAELGSRYVRAQGGSASASTAAPAGRQGAVRLGQFLTQVARDGLDAALQTRGLAGVAGQSVEFLLDQLLDNLAPPGESLEQEVARLAMSRTLDELFEEALEGDGIESLDHMSEAKAAHALEVYLANYINARLMQALSDRNEAKCAEAEQAVALEEDIQDYVRDTVHFDMEALNLAPGELLALDWPGSQGSSFVERVFITAFDMLEAAQ